MFEHGGNTNGCGCPYGGCDCPTTDEICHGGSDGITCTCRPGKGIYWKCPTHGKDAKKQRK